MPLGDLGYYDDYGNYVSGPGEGGTTTYYGNVPYDPTISTPPFFGGSYGGGSTVGGTNFWDAFTKGLTSATSILGTRYAVPQLNPGQVIQTGPGGVSFMSQAQTGGSMQTSSLGLGASSGTLMLLAGAAVVAFMLFNKGH